jgi:hypothetical protein
VICVRKHAVLIFLFFAVLAAFAPMKEAFAGEPYFFLVHCTRAQIKGSKAVYDDVYFRRVHIDITDADPKNSVSLTVRGGSYTCGSPGEFATGAPGTIVDGQDKTFRTKYFSEYSAHLPVNAARDPLRFWGKADTGFSEKEFAYTLDFNPEVTGVLPKIRSTGEQMASYVPYVEYVVNEGKITALILRMVKPSSPEIPLVKSEDVRTGYIRHVDFFDARGKRMLRESLARTISDGQKIEMEIKLSKPLDPTKVYEVDVIFADATKGTFINAWYAWYFESDHRKVK